MDLPRGLSGYSRRKIIEQTNRPVPAAIQSLTYNPTVTIPQLEMYWIDQALVYCNGNKSQAARLLGIGKATIYKKLRERSQRGL